VLGQDRCEHAWNNVGKFLRVVERCRRVGL
jgi:hypothetical protein